jgi:hypothetical protein
MLSSFVQSPRPTQKHACHQYAERDVIESVRENVHDSRPIALTLARKRAIFWWTFPHSVKRPRYARPPLPTALVCRGNAQAADQSFSLLTWQILTLHSCVGAAVNGFGGYRECRSCGRRGHCGVWWGSWRMHGRNCTVAPAILAHIEMRRLGKFS